MLHQRESTTLFAQVPCDLEDLLLSDITDPFLFETDQADSPDLDKVFDDALFLDLLTPPYSPVDVFKEISEAAYVDQILVEHDYSKPWQEETTTTTVIEVPVDDGIVLDESPVYSPVPRPASSSSSSDSTQETSDSDVDVVTVTSDPEFSEFEPVKARKPRRKYIRKDYLPSTGAITKKPLTGRRRGRKPAYIVHSENSSPYESEQDKKETHNQLERKRRNDLSRAYQDVRLLIPSLQDNPRASKVKILESAASLVHSFSQQNLEEVLRKEKKEVDRLMREINRIQSLQ